MNLFTPEQYKQLLQNGSPENRDSDHPPVVKLFLPGSGCTWLLCEIYSQTPDIAFGLCDLGLGFPELGDLSLSELEEISHPYFDACVEVDISFEAQYPISVYATAAWMVDRITDDETILKVASTVRKQKGYVPG